jgi:biotin-(acetyl-CoA carboxylase) ligase
VTSLFLESKKELDLKSVLNGLLKSIEIVYLRFQREGISAIHEEYLANLLFVGEMRRYKTLHGDITGKIVNVLSSGQIEIKTKEGQLFNFDIKQLEFLF